MLPVIRRRPPILLLVSLGLITAVTIGAAGEKPWYRRCLVGLEVGPTGAQFGSDRSDIAYAARFNGADIVRKSVAANAEYIVIWARDSEYAYYDSKVAPKCPGLGDRDVLRETVEAARPHGLPVIAYCVVQGNGYPLRENPEFRMRDSNGQPIGRVCLNSGYLEHIEAVCKEMLSYGIDGFHIDMLDQGFGPPYGCWCPNCQRLFEEEYGSPMPNGVTWDAAWDRMMQFRFNTSARFEQRLLACIRSVDPDATVDYNYHGNPPFSWEVGQRPVQHAIHGEFVTGETGVWGFSALGVGEHAEFYAATRPGEPYQVAMQRGVRMYHDQTVRPLNDLRWELLTLLAHGAFVTIVDKTPYDGTLDRVAYDRMGRAFAEVLEKREHFGQPPHRVVGIYYSSRTRDWYARETPSRYQQSFHGAHKAMVYEHVPWGILLDENTTDEILESYSIVLLPNAAILSPEEISRFRRWVEKGGKLVTTGFTGLFDRMGEQLEKSAIEGLIGARVREKLASIDNHIRFPLFDGAFAALHRDIPLDWPFLVKGPAVAYEPTSARPVGEILRPHRTVRQLQGKEGTDWPMSADRPVGPAILVNHVGRGTVVCLAGSPDFAIAGEHRVAEARLLLRNVVRFLEPSPAVRVMAPLEVESVITDDRKTRTLRVHLLGYNAPPTGTPARNRPYVLPALVEQPPLYRARVEIGQPLVSARALDPATKLVRRGNAVELLVEDIHEVVVIEYAD